MLFKYQYCDFFQNDFSHKSNNLVENKQLHESATKSTFAGMGLIEAQQNVTYPVRELK